MFPPRAPGVRLVYYFPNTIMIARNARNATVVITYALSSLFMDPPCLGLLRSVGGS